MPGKALIIDDDQSIRFVLRNALTQSGWSVSEIDDGSEAEDRLAKERFDLVVLDLYMPGMNGYEVLRRLRRHPEKLSPAWKTPSDVRVLVISGEAGVDGLAFAERIGADACLSKPFDVSEVQRRAAELWAETARGARDRGAPPMLQHEPKRRARRRL